MNKRDLGYLKKIYFDLSGLAEGLIALTLISIAVQIGELIFFTKSGDETTGIFFPLLMVVVSLVIGLMVSSTHTTIGSMPVKAGWSAKVASFSLDAYALVTLISSTIILIAGDCSELIIPRIPSLLVAYAISNIVLYAASVPGGSKNAVFDIGNNASSAASFFGGVGEYILVMVCVIGWQIMDETFATNSLTDLDSTKRIVYIVILAVSVILATVSRVLSNKGIDSKLRLKKIYRKKKKRVKIESYV